MKLIIQIPAFNEAAVIERTLQALPSKIEGIDVIETLVIDDGSSDETAAIARRAGAHVVRLLSHRGLSAAFVAGIDAALQRGADIIVNTDADDQYQGSGVAALVEPILAGRAELVIGDRDVARSPHMSGGKRLLQRFGSRAVALLSGLEISDATSGFRAFSRDAALQLNVFNPFTYTLETIVQAGYRNLRVESVRIATNAPTRPSRLYRGVFRYIRKSVVTLFRVYTLYKPLKTFFALGGTLFTAGTLIGLRFLYHYLHGNGAGHVQSLILAAVLLVSGTQTMLAGLLADLISVNRRLSEEVLIRLRRNERRGGDGRRAPAERRREHARSRHPEKPAPLPAPQWVWLVDETASAETSDAAPVPASKEGDRRKRRRRKRPERRVMNRDRHAHRKETPPDEP